MAARTSREVDSGARRVVSGARLVVVAVAVLAAVLVSAPGSAASAAPYCADVTLVWARGSGQPTMTLGETDTDEGTEFLSNVWGRLPDYIEDLVIYELGRDNLNYGIEHSYPAYEVSNKEAYDAWRGAYVEGWPESFEKEGGYVSSVKTGVKELAAFLTQRASDCPSEIFVLGGYSQGAHVIGLALSDPVDGVPRWVRDRIAFAALIADPTLWLPKGVQLYVHLNVGPFDLWVTEELRPVACRGWATDTEVYRRGNPPCWAQHGILAVSEYRTPYLPADMVTGRYGTPWTSRVGAWCIMDDPICTNTAERVARYVLSGDGFVGAHDDYTNPDRGPDGHRHWVEQAADEAASRARQMWLNERAWRIYRA